MTRETLDDAVDRVADELTAAGNDPTFGARLRGRLDEPEGAGRAGRIAAASIATIAFGLAIGAVMFRDGQRPPVHAPTTALATSAARQVADPVEKPSPPTAARPAARRAAAARDIGQAATDIRTAIEALPVVPGSLAVADLQVEPLIVPSVNLTSLDVEELSVARLAIANEQ